MLKILIPYFRIPPENGHIMIQIKNILEELEKTEPVDVCWLVYSPYKLDKNIKYENKMKILDIHDYQNGLDVLKKEKPDIVFAGADYNLIAYSLCKSAQFLKILTVGSFSTNFFMLESLPFRLNFNLFFYNSRLKFFLYKFYFTIKTQLSIKMNVFQIIQENLLLLKYNLKNQILTMEPKFSADLHWLASESLIKPLLNAGFKRNSLVVTGDPTYDKIFSRLNKLEPKKQDKKIDILFAPSTYYEHGLCSEFEQDAAINEIISTILQNKEEWNLIIKIHPASTDLKKYKKLIDKIDIKIPIYQNEDIVDLIIKSDIVIVFPETSVIPQALIAQKLIIVYNFLDRKDMFVTKGCALECKNNEMLFNMIKSKDKNSISKEKIVEEIEKLYYKVDGLASQRVAENIIKRITNR